LLSAFCPGEEERSRLISVHSRASGFWLPACAGMSGVFWRLHHHRQFLRRARYTRIEPALAAVGKRKRLIEQNHVVPLRALRFVYGEHVAVVELVVGFAPLPIDLLDPAGKTFRPH